MRNCTMLDEVVQRLDQKIQTVMGLDCIEILTAAGTVMNSDWYSDSRRDIEIDHI